MFTFSLMIYEGGFKIPVSLNRDVDPLMHTKAECEDELLDDIVNLFLKYRILFAVTRPTVVEGCS